MPHRSAGRILEETKMATTSNKPDAVSDFVIDHVAVSVSNLNRSIEFYQRNFGFACERVTDMLKGNGKVALLKKQGFTIEMFEISNALPLPEYRKTFEGDLKTIGVKHFAVRVRDITGAYDFLKNNGVDFSSEPVVGGRGFKRFFLKDPDGIQIEITEY